jgi:VWFA-related protein
VLLGLTLAPPPVTAAASTDSIDVHVVNVEVYVTRRGAPVMDLAPEDFQIFENGKPVPLSHFQVVSRPREGAPAPAKIAAGEVSATPKPSVVPVDDEPAHVVVYVDETHIRPQNRNLLLSQMHAFVESGLGAGDRVMVVTAGDGGLVVNLPFSEDRQALRETLDGLRRRATQRPMDDTEQLRILADLEYADTDETMDDALNQLEMAQHAQRERARTTLRQMEYFVTALAGLPGRKTMLYLSDGIAGTTDEEYLLFERIAAAANTHRVTFYGFDARGWRPDVKINPATRGGPMTDLVNETLNTHIERPLRDLSSATGGFAVTGHTNFDGALEKVSVDLTRYYSLGYTPPNPEDLRYRRIQVKVKGRGFDVRHREGYQMRRPLDRLADQTLAALTFDSGENPLAMVLAPAPAESAESAKSAKSAESAKSAKSAESVKGAERQIPILVQLPAERLTLLPDRERFTGEVTLLVLIQGLDGKLIPAREVRLPIAIPRARMEGPEPLHIAYKLQVPLGDEGFKIAVGAKDALSRVTSFAVLRVGG